MINIKWIKIATNIFDDEKITLIETLPDADTILVIWFKLLSLAGKCNDSGLIYLARDIPYNDEMLSTILRRPVNTIRLALDQFQKLKMIEIVDDIIMLLNWEKHQSTDELDKIKESNRLRQKKHREQQKEITNNVTVTLRNGTDKNRIDKNREDKIRIDKKKDSIIEIIEFWNCQQLQQHKKEVAIKKMQKKHIDIIENYTIAKVKESISNYNTVVNDDKYFFNYRWTLWEFITRGVDNFVNESKPFEKYTHNNIKKTKSYQQRLAENIELEKKLEKTRRT